MSARRVVRRAPAKINLSLRVLGRRADGYHELDTVLLALPLADRIELAERARGPDELHVSGPACSGVPQDASNLAWRAVALVRELARARRRPAGAFELALEKHVPAAAGLGGGSSDAAAAALAAAELWGLEPGDPDLDAGLASLGSDCPFFLHARSGGLARCTGRGERVEPLAALELPWALLLLTPAVGCSTAAVYGALAPVTTPPAAGLDPAGLRGCALAEARARLVNDLEPAALRSHPELAAFRELLEEEAPGAFRLAGSGSSYFAFCADAREAAELGARLAQRCEARRYGLRGRWTSPLKSGPMDSAVSNSH